MIDLSQFAGNIFANETFVKKVEKPWGYEIIFTPPELTYAGKILHIQADKRLSLQVHDKKQESYLLVSGQCQLIRDNTEHQMEEVEMEKMKGYTIAIGQRHRLHAITDCDIFEVSTAEIGTTYRLEDDYKRPDETEEIRKDERKNL